MSLLLPPLSSPAGPNELAACDDLPPGWGEGGRGGEVCGKAERHPDQHQPSPNGSAHPRREPQPDPRLAPNPSLVARDQGFHLARGGAALDSVPALPRIIRPTLMIPGDLPAAPP